MNQEKRTNISNRLLGSYQAEVVDVVHPKALYMVTVRLLGLWDGVKDYDLPYAEFLLPLGARPSQGHVVPVEKGNLVWVDFPRNGDTRYPRITGSLYHAPDHQSNLPDEVNGEAYEPKRHPDEPEPTPYDRKDDLYHRFGFRELRSQSGGWSVTHVDSGTAVEITPEGQMVIHTEGDQFQSATGNHKGQYDGQLDIIVKGNATMKCDGDGMIDAGKNLTLKAGDTIMFEANMVKGSASDYDFK